MYHVLNDCKCEDSNDGAFVVWFFVLIQNGEGGWKDEHV